MRLATAFSAPAAQSPYSTSKIYSLLFLNRNATRPVLSTIAAPHIVSCAWQRKPWHAAPVRQHRVEHGRYSGRFLQLAPSAAGQPRAAAGGAAPVAKTNTPPPAKASVDSSGSTSSSTFSGRAGEDQSLHWRDVWRLLRPDAPLLAACAACALVSVVSNVLVAPTMGKVIDVISKGALSTTRDLAMAVGKLGAVYISSNVALAVQVGLSVSISESLAARMRGELFQRLLGRDTLFFDQVRTGQMTSWLGQDVEVLQTTVAKLLGARGVRSAFETVGIIIMLFTLSPLLASVLLVSAPLLTPLIFGLTRKIGAASKTAQGAAADVSAAADEVIENMKVVKLFGAEGREMGRFRDLVDASHQLAARVIWLQGLLDVSGRLRNTMCVLSTLGLGTWLALAGKVTLGTCYAFFIFAFSFAFSLGNLANTSGDLAKAAGAAARALAVLRQAEGRQDGGREAAAASPTSSSTEGLAAGAAGQQDDVHSMHSVQSVEAGAREAEGSSHPVTLQELRGDIEFRGVSFRHPGWEGWTLEGISFKVPAGSTVALVGPSGGGKSTLASLLMGLYSAAEGEILVDGTHLSHLDLGWWRRQLGVVMQDAGLMTGQIRDIIAYGNPSATNAEVEAAARAAQAHGFICQLPRGYQTEIGPRGVELSGGQQQRLAIARALMVRPKVLLFDEATSALDVETEASVSEAMHEAGRGTTMLVIAHRLSTVRRADSIVVIAAGKLAEQGSHEELMRLGGVYARLVRKAARRGGDSWQSDGSVGAQGPGSDSESETAAVPTLSSPPAYSLPGET